MLYFWLRNHSIKQKLIREVRFEIFRSDSLDAVSHTTICVLYVKFDDIIIIIRSASHTVALVQTKIATYTKKINLKSKSKYTKERFYLNQY